MNRSLGHRCSTGAALRAVLLILLGSFPVAAQAGAVTAMQWEAPAETLGDGESSLRVRLRLDPGVRDMARVKVAVSAGRIVSRRELEAGLLELTLVPPRVVEPILLGVEAKTHGQRAKLEIRLLPALPPAEIGGSSGALDLRAPKYLILGHDERALVTFRSRSVSPIHLYASAGTIDAPEPDGRHRYRAVYTPPADKLPRVVVVVAASEDGSVVDWVAIRLYGRPLVAALSEPHATVIARVAGTDYGPVQADQRGRVEIRVLAPPGVAQAQTIARDAMGNERTVQLKLGVPAAREDFAICPPASEGIFLFAVDASGESRKGLKLRIESSLGTPSPVQWSDAGYYTSSLSVPSNATLGERIRLKVRVEGEKAPRIFCESTVVGEAPTRLQLNVASKAWVAGSVGELRVMAHAGFAGERTARTVPIQVTTDFGEVTPLQAQTTDLYAGSWRLPNDLAGRQRAKIVVRTFSQRPVVAEASIELHAGPPSRLELLAQQRRLKADGYSETRLTAKVFDAYGNLVDVYPEVAQAEGALSPFTRESMGVFSSTYQAPKSTSLERDDVIVRVGGKTIGQVRMALVPTSNRFRLWAAVGYSTNFAMVQAPLISAGGGVRLPLLRDHVAVGFDLGYLAASANTLDATGAENVTLRTTQAPINARVTYEQTLARFTPYLGAGAGVSLVHLDLSSPSAGGLTQWKVRPLVLGAAGTRMRVGPGAALLEASFRYVPVNEPYAAGNVGGLVVGAGYLYEL